MIGININDSIPNEQIRAKAFKMIPLAYYKQFLNDCKKPNLDHDFYRWSYYGKSTVTIKKNIFLCSRCQNFPVLKSIFLL